MKFYKFLLLLASQCGDLLNLNELSNTLGISRTSAENYLYILQKSFIANVCPTFQSNKRKELTKMPKVFLTDPGFRNSLLDNFKPLTSRVDGGGTFENLFFAELFKAGNENIKFWRTQDRHEIDFVVDDKFGFELKLNPKKFISNRYDRFRQAYPHIPLNLVVPEDERELDLLDFCT